MTSNYLVIGNWKMYKDIEEAVSFVRALTPMIQDVQVDVGLAVPFTAIASCALEASDSLMIGAQNMHDATTGAFTGEIAASMLVDAGASFVILGHSERRHIFGETSDFVNRKVHRALEEGLIPIVCVGETLEEREEDKTWDVLQEQIDQSLANISNEKIKNLLIAYEPVWAIGTGKTASPEQAQEVHEQIRAYLEEKWGEKGKAVRLLYGGSVKPDNTESILKKGDIEGVLVGGASLLPETFNAIVQNAKI